jgi:hypothetical protein
MEKANAKKIELAQIIFLGKWDVCPFYVSFSLFM